MNRPCAIVLLFATLGVGELRAQDTIPGNFADSTFCENANRNARAAPPGSRTWEPGIELLGHCKDAAETIVYLWQQVPDDSVTLRDLAVVSMQLQRNTTILEAMTSIATDHTRSRMVRLAAVKVLLSYADSTWRASPVGPYLNHPESAWGVGILLSGYAPRTPPGALPADVRERVTELVYDLALNDDDPLFRRQLGVAALFIDPDRWLAPVRCERAERIARTAPPESRPWRDATETLRSCRERQRRP